MGKVLVRNALRRVDARGQAWTAVALLLVLVGASCSGRRHRPSKQDDPLPHYHRGTEFLRQGRAERAAEEFLAALAIEPAITVARNSLGLAYIGMGDLKKARKEFEHVLDEDPYFTDAHNNLGIVLSQMGEYDEALVHFNMVLRDGRYPTPELARLNIGRLLLERGEVRESLLYFKAAVDAKPDRADWRFLYAMALSQDGDPGAARTQLEKAVELRGDYYEALFELGVICHELSDNQAACGYLKRLIERSPTSELARKARSLIAEIQIVDPSIDC